MVPKERQGGGKKPTNKHQQSKKKQKGPTTTSTAKKQKGLTTTTTTAKKQAVPPNTKPSKSSKNTQKTLYKEQQKALSVFNLFTQFYGKQWGKRWPSLLSAMEKPNSYCSLLNLFASLSALSSLVDLPSIQPVPFLSLPCLIRGPPSTDPSGAVPYPYPTPSELPFPSPSIEDNLYNYYPLDAASVLVTEALQVQPHDTILDVCAAPGGKTLAILQRMFFSSHLDSWSNLTTHFSPNSFDEWFKEVSSSTTPNTVTGSLICNDISPSRVTRLKKTINSYIPKPFRTNITVTQKDATSQGAFSTCSFSKILIDAPCSSERHLVRNSNIDFDNEEDKKEPESSDSFGSDSSSDDHPKEGTKEGSFNFESYSPEFLNWGQSRSRKNSLRQIALLKNCLQFLVEDGLIVYATCSVSHLENDGVVEKVIQKARFEVECEWKEWKIGERTKYGWMVLPDKEEGWGPLYFSVLRKGPEKIKKRDRDEKEEEEEEEKEEEDEKEEEED